MNHHIPDGTAQPTQVAHPAKATTRTVLQLVVGLAVALPIFVSESGIDNTIPFVATALAVSAAVARIMAIPVVNIYLGKYLGLGAEPQPKRNEIV